MAIKSFFNKAGRGIRTAFRKTEDVAQMVKRDAPGFIDTALRKTANTLGESAPIVGKIGQALSMASPALAAVPGVGMGLAAGGSALGTALSKSERGIGKTAQLVGDIRSEVRRPTGGARGIQASKPEPPNSDPVFY